MHYFFNGKKQETWLWITVKVRAWSREWQSNYFFSYWFLKCHRSEEERYICGIWGAFYLFKQMYKIELLMLWLHFNLYHLLLLLKKVLTCFSHFLSLLISLLLFTGSEKNYSSLFCLFCFSCNCLTQPPGKFLLSFFHLYCSSFFFCFPSSPLLWPCFHIHFTFPGLLTSLPPTGW